MIYVNLDEFGRYNWLLYRQPGSKNFLLKNVDFSCYHKNDYILLTVWYAYLKLYEIEESYIHQNTVFTI